MVPPILVVNYKLPAHPRQVKEELQDGALGLPFRNLREVSITIWSFI